MIVWRRKSLFDGVKRSVIVMAGGGRGISFIGNLAFLHCSGQARCTCCALDEAGRQLLRNAAAQMNLSARAYHRVLKLAGSPLGAIADLAGEESIQTLHLAEALQYRPRHWAQFNRRSYQQGTSASRPRTPPRSRRRRPE